jgi:hypothetical protein
MIWQSMDTLSILYTHNLRGDLHLLPRLYSFIQQVKREHDAQALLLDLGNACSDDVWHCEVTKGRSTVTVMDAMGYHAVNVSDFMGDSERDSLANSVSVGLVTKRHMWRYYVPPIRDEDIVIAGQATPAMKLCIIAAPAANHLLENRMLHLKSIDKGEVGLVKVDLRAMSITAENRFAMPEGIKPDATIAASVELIEEEARFAQKRL